MKRVGYKVFFSYHVNNKYILLRFHKDNFFIFYEAPTNNLPKVGIAHDKIIEMQIIIIYTIL